MNRKGKAGQRDDNDADEHSVAPSAPLRAHSFLARLERLMALRQILIAGAPEPVGGGSRLGGDLDVLEHEGR